ncbi:hypothetical protein E1211_28190 [Micromonospora sp. 15K316]|uniref:hypothetical protein n=1 Tax=Micromonospora sp. 15K316 TaxID=2530376 RepID=UPI001044258D|nr:hypothetical protein [Micromonospora sp. 15K316]TDC28265.1 hypothetical protein E1211_28190 [Micromonospora sp. 15K316]
MTQPPTGPQGYPPPDPAQPPAVPGQPPYDGATTEFPQQPTPYGVAQPTQPMPPVQPGAPTQPFPAQPFSAPPAPAGVPPYAGQVSAPPTSGPGPDQPMSVPPVSGPYYGAPMSAPPGFAPPYGQPAPSAGKGRTVLVLALVAGLFFVLGGVMTGLYVTKNSELDRTERRLSAQVSERDGTIAANAQEIQKLKTDLQGVQDKLADTEQDLTGTRNDRDEQARQKKVIATCLDKLTTALAASAAGDKSAYDKAMSGLDKVCDEAENYL